MEKNPVRDSIQLTGNFRGFRRISLHKALNREKGGRSMARSAHQKLKILYLYRMLLEKTDEDHRLTVNEMIQELNRWGIEAERKTIYSDLEALRSFGLDILSVKARSTGYYVASRTFDLPELKLLADAVAGAKFITEKKSRLLIAKLGQLASQHEGRSLQRNVLVQNRVKADNELIYYNVDTISQAITRKESLRFRYFEFDLNRKKVLRKDGDWYAITPLTLFWDDENYYVIAYYQRYGRISHFRVDRMEQVEITPTPEDVPLEKLDIGAYAKKTFSMFVGEEEHVRLEFSNKLINVVYDKFGKDVSLRPGKEGHFQISVPIAVSPSFYGWLFQFGEDVQILSPDHVAGEFRSRSLAAAQRYSS